MKNKGFFRVRNAIIALVLFMCMNFLINGSPYGLGKLIEITGGHSILDMELMGYSVDRAYEVLEALGEEGRAFNMKFIVPLDFAFPLTYGLFYFVTLTLIMKNIRKNIKKPWLIGLVGVFATLFDYLENIMVINLLQSYPNRLDGVAKIASVFTQLKSLFIVLSMVVIIAGLLIIIIKKINLKVKTKAG